MKQLGSMNLKAVGAAAVLAAGGLALCGVAPAAQASPATVATSIHKVSCGTRTDFLKIWYNGGSSTVCYADAGTVNVDYKRVTKLTSGNNAGDFTTSDTGGGFCGTFSKHATLTYSHAIEIVNIDIY